MRQHEPRAQIAVIGCGHVGLVTAACLAELGHTVTGVDTNATHVAALQAGEVPFLEPGLAALVQRGLRAGRLSFTSEYRTGIAGAGFVFLCVNTPATVTGAADLRAVRAAVTQIAEALAPGEEPPLIVNKSTSPLGIAEAMEGILARLFTGSRRRPVLVANPEFLREGSAIRDFLCPDRIVIGAADPEDARRVDELYAAIPAPRVLTDLRTAEIVKYVSNAFLATRVSFVNEVARLCEALGADVDTVVEGVGLDRRIGRAFFTPGIGYGGSCLPKDVAALCHIAESAGLTLRLLTAVQEVNLCQRKHAVNSIRRILGPLEGQTVAAWGVTFKGGTEDLRDSPALDVIALLRNEGAIVRVYDPSLSLVAAAPFADELCPDPLTAAQGADCVAVLADWPEFRAVDWHAVRQVM